MKIKEICEYGKKSKIKAGEGLSEGNVKFFTSSSESNKFVKEEQFTNPGIIMGTGGNATLHYCDEPFSVSTDCIVLFPKIKVSPKYLYYFFKGNFHVLQSGFKGAGLKHTSKKYIDEISLNHIPSNDEQVQIVNILDNVNDIIVKKNQQLQEYVQLIKSRFVELFGDPITNTKGLPTKDLKDVLILKAGDFTTASDISDIPTHTNIYPCYGGNGIRGYVEEYNQEGEYSLVGRQGALSGNVQYARGKFKNTEHALLVSPIIEMNSIWLNQLLLNLDLKRYQTGAAQPGLSVKNLQEIQILMVPLNVQKVYALFVEQVDKLKFVVQKSLDETQKLFDSLMQEYFG